MKFQDLNQNDQMLVQTKFPASLEKEAAAEAGLVHELYSTGFSKLAAQTVSMIEKAAEEGEEEGEEEEGEESEKKDEGYKEKMDEGEKKEAAARGAFIARGYIDGLMKQGAARTGDPYYYIYDLLAEKVAHHPEMSQQEKMAAADILGKLKSGVGAARGMFSSGAAKAKAAVPQGAKDKAKAVKEHYQKRMGGAKDDAMMAAGYAKGQSGNYRGMIIPKGERAKALGRAAKAVAPEAAGVAALGGGTMYAMNNRGS